MYKKYVLIILIIFSLFITENKTTAHPHVFIEYWTNIVFEKGKLKGIWVNWYFDEFFSAMVIRQNDKNKNKKFEKNEVKIVKKRAFDNLKNFKYFTYLNINRKLKTPKWINTFNAKIRQNRLIYSFFVPLNVKIKSSKQKLRIKYQDPTIYVAFSPHKNPIRVKKTTKVKVQTKKTRHTQSVTFRR